jgi:hypothetical protein
MANARKLGIGAALAVSALTAHSASAQIYSTGPGFYMSLEGRYLQNDGDKMRLSPQPTLKDDVSGPSIKLRNDKDLGGKAGAGYRFENNWDIGVSTSGMKNLR